MKISSVFWLGAALVLLSVSQGFAASEWGIEGEEKARFEAKVVDIACELTGSCPSNCGDGTRQLGLLKDDATLYLVPKNFEPFAGATNDLLPFCGQRILADGLLIKTKHMPMFALQFLRKLPDGEWDRATRFTRDWSAKHKIENSENWFRKDPMVKNEIARSGVFGIPGLKPEEE